MKLASGGVAPVPEMLEAGVVVGLGTDSPISNNGMDVFADMKVAALLHKATRWDARIMPAQTVFDLATIHAARALHVERDIGSIEVGKNADVVLWSGDPFSVYSRAEKVWIDGAMIFDRLDPAQRWRTDFELGFVPDNPGGNH